MATVIFAEPGTDETRNLSLFTVAAVGTVASATDQAYTGLRSVKATTDGATTSFCGVRNILANAGRRIAAYVRLEAAPSAAATLISNATEPGAVGRMSMQVNTDRTLILRPNGAPNVNGTTVLSLNTWYRIALSYVIVNSTTFSAKLYINGVLECSAVNTGTLTGTDGVSLLLLANLAYGAGKSVWFDDILVDNGTDLADPVPYALTVAGAVTPAQPNWSVSQSINGRTTFNFRIKSIDASYRPALNATVGFLVGGDRRFSGLLAKPVEAGLGDYGVTPIMTHCTAQDYSWLGERRYVTLDIAAGTTLKNGIIALLATGALPGVTIDPAQVNGPNLPALSYDLSKVMSILDDFTKQSSGYIYTFGYGNVLTFALPGATAAPYNITVPNCKAIGDVTVEKSFKNYYNRIVVRFTEPIAEAVATFDLIATANFAAGETVTLGSQTVTFDGAGDHDPVVGASTALSLDNLAAAFADNSVVTCDSSSGTHLYIHAVTPGSAGNAIATTETCANASWLNYDTGVTASSALTGLSTANDAGEQATYGIWEAPPVSMSEITDQTAADAASAVLLVKGVAGRKRIVRYKSNTAGLFPAMSQTVTLPMRDLSGSWIITDVTTRDLGPGLLQYEVALLEGTDYKPGWQADFRQMQARA